MNEDSALKSKYFWIVLILLVISIASVYVIATRFLNQSKEQYPDQCTTQKPANIETRFTQKVPDDFAWWSDTYSYTKQLSVENAHPEQVLPQECWIIATFDHAELVDEKKSQEDGLDLKLIYQDGDTFQEVPFILNNPNTTETSLEFKSVSTVAPTVRDDNYFLYYSNILAETNELIIEDIPENRSFAQMYETYRTRELHPKVTGYTSRQWIVQDPQVEEKYTSIVYTLELDSSVSPTKTPTYEVLNSNLSGSLEKISKREYTASINPASLQPGKYQLQVTVEDQNETFKTPKTYFFVSKPLFVTFTVDYEGSDVPDENLAELVEFAEGHPPLPIVHLFNPHIYVAPDISQNRADYLTQWILVRKLNGDEVGMHLHMRNEMVQAAGVDVRKTPKWTSTLDNGHDVPCSAYTYDEFTKIVSWAKEQFLTEGLGEPVTFRAGGWFADETTLKVLDHNNFKIDTSGREYTSWGNLSLHWQLSSTTKPYHPSESNQNAATPLPQLRLWEFPNNGGDSYKYTVEQMIQRFNDNYKRQPLTEKQTVTYLTHPHDFSADREKLDPTFSHIDQYLLRNDNGPVLYVTLEDALGSYSR